LHHQIETALNYACCLDLEGTMLNHSVLFSEAQFAIEHAARLKRLIRHRPSSRLLQRRVRTLEEEALRMELEAKARSVCHWRAQSDERASQLPAVEFSEIDYLDAHR
jgi:hypothetical protein